MSQSIVVRDKSITVSEEDRATVLRVILSALRGVDDQNQKRWALTWRRLLGMEHGECGKFDFEIPRCGPFHRLHMKIEQDIFDAQDRFTHFEQFRNWIKIGSGFVDWVRGPTGGVVPLPKSISYASLEEPDFREFHNAFLAFMRGPHAAPYLWRNLDKERAHEMMESVLAGFDR